LFVGYTPEPPLIREKRSRRGRRGKNELWEGGIEGREGRGLREWETNDTANQNKTLDSYGGKEFAPLSEDDRRPCRKPRMFFQFVMSFPVCDVI
jgi:hypothetical protein